MGHEYADVEQPFIDQCVAMGWQAPTGDKDQPALTGRGSFKEVIQNPPCASVCMPSTPAPTASPGWIRRGCLKRSAP